VAVRPSRPAKDCRLGLPLPHQLPNLKQAHFIAIQSLFFYPILKNNSIGITIFILDYKANSCFILTRAPRELTCITFMKNK